VTSALFSPLTIRDLEIRNRLWVAPLCQYSVSAGDGVPHDWHLVHLGSFARGGAGLVIAEATAVVPDGRISLHDTGLWNEQQMLAWRRIVDFIHGQGAAAGVQLAHAGRKASTYPEWGTTTDGHSGRGTMPAEHGGWTTVAPSAIAFEGYGVPAALDEAGIQHVIDGFVSSARLAVEAGFDLVELHAAHGYLLHQFLSPLSNRRDDAWGGSLENRARLLLDIVRAVRSAVDVPVLVRFSGTDWVEGGWDEHQTAQVAGWAVEAGADLFDISSGGLVRAKIPVGPGYQVPLAAHVRSAATVPVSAVGLITEAQQAEAIIASGEADAIMMGREWMRDPHAAQRFAAALGEDEAHAALVPPQYVRAHG